MIYFLRFVLLDLYQISSSLSSSLSTSQCTNNRLMFLLLTRVFWTPWWRFFFYSTFFFHTATKLYVMEESQTTPSAKSGIQEFHFGLRLGRPLTASLL